MWGKDGWGGQKGSLNLLDEVKVLARVTTALVTRSANSLNCRLVLQHKLP